MFKTGTSTLTQETVLPSTTSTKSEHLVTTRARCCSRREKGVAPLLQLSVLQCGLLSLPSEETIVSVSSTRDLCLRGF